jgi:uncharacterized membrane protein AbrB (regulator of aidB expression)
MYDVSSKTQYKFMTYIYIIILYATLIIVNISEKKHQLGNSLYNLIQKCVIYIEHPLVAKLTSLRGKNNFTVNDVEKNLENKIKQKNGKNNDKYCILSLWALTHIFLYMLIGFFCPDLFIPSFIIGVIYEIFEKYSFDCHDVLDIFYNSLGFGIGFGINKMVFTNNKDSVSKILLKALLIIIIAYGVFILSMVKKIQEFTNIKIY